MKNKLEKFNVGRASVHVRFDARGEYAHPMIQFKQAGEHGWTMFEVVFQRNALRLNGALMNEWERHRSFKQAATVAGTVLDVGGIAYSPCYAGKVEVKIDELKKVADIMAIVGRATPPGYGEPDELILMVEGLKNLNVSVDWQFHGSGGQLFDHAFEVPDQYRNKCRAMAESAEAQDVIAEYHRKEAARIREEEQERAATAQKAVA